jgi:spoIIIJ-associated protein
LSQREKKNRKDNTGGDTLLKESTCTAATIEEAQAAAIAQLNAPEDADVTIEVIDIPVKKTLGIFGGNQAKVRAYYEEADLSDYMEAETYLRTILNGMGIKEAKIEIKEVENDIHIQLDCGDDFSTVIGRRGETLDAIQYLTRLNISQKNEGYKRVLINIGSYREKRESTLREIAKKNAEKAKKTGRNMCLDPMNPYERRIIHTTIQDIEGVESHSVGSDNDRRVVITAAGGTKPAFRPQAQRDGYRDERRAPAPYSKDRLDVKKPVNNSSAPRTPRSDAAAASRYEKIEPKKN